MKRSAVLPVFLFIVLAAGLMPLPAFAEEGSAPEPPSLGPAGTPASLAPAEVGAQGDEESVYAILYSNGDLVFQHGDEADVSRGAVVKSWKTDLEMSAANNSSAMWCASEYKDKVEKAVFKDRIAPLNLSGFFSGCADLRSIEGIDKLDTVNVTDMSGMFFGCSRLAALDLSSFNTSNVTDMTGMFQGCSQLASLNLSNFNTAKVTDMTGMFIACLALTSLDLSSFDTAKVTSMNSMFSDCQSLSSLNLSKFDTSNVTDMAGMFQGCGVLKYLDAPRLVSASVTNAAMAFDRCSSLIALDMSGWNTAGLKGQDATKQLDLSGCTSLGRLVTSANVTLGKLPPDRANDKGWWSLGESKYYSFAELLGSRVGTADTYLRSATVANMQEFYELIGDKGWSDQFDDLKSLVVGYEPVRTYTHMGAENDATSMRNVFRALQYIRECNAIRESRNLKPLMVTSRCMVAAEMNANFEDEYGYHSHAFPLSENLALGHFWPDVAYQAGVDNSNPFYAWFDTEEVRYNAFIAEHPEAKDMRPAELVVNYPSEVTPFGHYLSIINDEYKTTGFGVSTDPSSTQGYTYSQTFDKSQPPAHSYTVDQFEGMIRAAFIPGELRFPIDGAGTRVVLDIPERGYYYDGSAKYPAAKVILSEGTEVPGGSYEVSYDNRIDAGTSTVTVTGTGDFKGTVTETFAINYANLSAGDGSVSISIPDNDYTYTGEALEPAVTVTCNGRELVAGKDFTVSYRNNVNANGYGRVTVAGTGNYTGGDYVDFRISAAKISDASISVPTQIYTGEACEPTPTVVWNGRPLKMGQDFTASYRNNVDSGTGEVAVIGKGNFGSSETVEFAIKPADITSVEVAPGNYVADGVPKEPELTVRAGSLVVPKSDYTAVYSSNTEPGTALVTVTGKGNYAGAKSTTFQIAANDKGHGNGGSSGNSNGWSWPDNQSGPNGSGQTADSSSVNGSSGQAGAGSYPSGSPELGGMGQAMYRLYNQWSGEHFYTGDADERDGVEAAGWLYEGVGWSAPAEGDPVYRVYNPYAGDHHYTLDAAERDALVDGGWVDEGVGWYSDPGKAVPLYREYNPNMFSCNHNYTADAAEHGDLVGLGWVDEGIAWYGV